MIIKYISNNRGITLVELLASLALIGVIGSLAVTILVQVINYNDNAKDEISLRQQANLIVTTLRTTYLNQINTYNVEFHDNNISAADQHIELPDFISISTINIEYGDQHITNGGQLIEIDGSSNTTLEINKLTLKNNQTNRTFSLSTIIDKPKLSINIDLPKSSKDNDQVFDERTDFDSIQIENPDSFEEIDKGRLQNQCEYTDNKKITHSNIGSWSSLCNEPSIIQGSGWMPNGLQLHSDITLTIEQNFYNEGSTQLNRDPNSNLVIDGNARFTGQISTHGDSSLRGNNIIAESNIQLNDNSIFTSTGGTRIDGGLTVLETSKFSVGNNLFADTITLEQTGQAFVQNNAVIDNLTTKSSSSILIEGNLTVNNLHFQQWSTITVNGNANFQNSVSHSGDGKMCIKGEAEFDEPLPDHMTTLYNANSCFEPEGYDIYIYTPNQY